VFAALIVAVVVSKRGDQTRLSVDGSPLNVKETGTRVVIAVATQPHDVTLISAHV